jgi:Fur family ferric uptake transcriptional regulator
MSDAAQVLRSAGLRATAPRIAVLDVLMDAAENHLTADEVMERVAAEDVTIHRATVYRALDQLRGEGLIEHVHLERGVAAFHASGITRDGGHLHAQCTRCGRIVDLPAGSLGRSAERVRASTGFELDLAHVALSGSCADCAIAPAQSP